MSAVAAAARHADSPEAHAARLYERHSRAIFGLCYRQLRRREDAEDAVQMTFVYALRSLRRGVVPQLELAWLLTIARNVCSTRRRNGMRRGEFETPQDLDIIQDRLAGPDRSDVATVDDFRDALQALPESQRKALLLREWRGLSYDEIGSELGLSPAATETLLFRARRNVAQRLSERIGMKSLQGLPLLTHVRNVFQAATAKTLVVGAGAALTIAMPAADPELQEQHHHQTPPVASASARAVQARETHRSPATPRPRVATKRGSRRTPVHHARPRTTAGPAPTAARASTTPARPAVTTPVPVASIPAPPVVSQAADAVTQMAETIALPPISLPAVTVSTRIATVTVQAPPLPPVHVP